MKITKQQALVQDASFRIDANSMSLAQVRAKYVSEEYSKNTVQRAYHEAREFATQDSEEPSEEQTEQTEISITEETEDMSHVTTVQTLASVATQVPGLKKSLDELLPKPKIDIENQICLSLTLKKPGNTRKADMSEVEVDADRAVLALRKKIFESDTFNEIKVLDVQIRAYVATNCIQADNILKAGMYIVPPSKVVEVDDKLQAFFTQRESLVNKFCAEWPTIIESLQECLRSLYDANDYPSANEMRGQFAADVHYSHMKKPDAMKGISAAIFAREQKAAQDRVNALCADVERTLYAKASQTVGTLIDALRGEGDASAKKKVVKDATVENWKAFFENLKAQNITGDTDLEAIAAAGKAALEGVDAKDLRTSDEAREELAKSFDAIKPLLEQNLINKPTRRIIIT